MRKRYIITPEEATIAREKMKKTKDKKVYRRLQIIALRGDGLKNKDVAVATGFSPSHISLILKKFSTGGFQTIESDGRTSNNRKASDEAVAKFLKGWEKSAVDGVIITTDDMREAFCKTFGTTITPQAFRRLLKRFGWSKKMPRPQHVKAADAKTIKASKKLKNEPEKLGSATT